MTSVRPQLDRRRALIVDDDADLAESLSDILVERGYEVQIANNRQAVQDICQGFDAQVALLDIRLHGESGLDVLAMLKQDNADMICVMITGYAETETAIDALRRGAYDYLCKPLHPNQIFALLERCFEKIRLEQEARSAYEAMYSAKEAAEAAARAKTEFLAAMGHELRTPLHSIIGFSEVLESEAFGKLGNKKYLEYAGDIKASGLHLVGIINSILEMIKAEAGRLELRESPAELGDIVGLVLRLTVPQANAADIEIKTSLAPDLPNLLCDEQKLRQVLLNLLSNAIKFTPKGGRIEVTAHAETDGAIVMAIHDTGIGIAAEDIPKALEPFSQIDSVISRSYEGTGLGLSLSTAMIELHGGTLTLESTPGQGTTVTLRFPPKRTLPRVSAAG